MSLNAMSAVRIGALLAVAAAGAWGAGRYLDLNAFKLRNADAIAMCEGFTPGWPPPMPEDALTRSAAPRSLLSTTTW